jgi:hypothetical protein
MAIADEKLAPVLPDAGLPAGLFVAATACCDFDPQMRPEFATLVPELEEAVQQLQVRVWMGGNRCVGGQRQQRVFALSCHCQGVTGVGVLTWLLLLLRPRHTQEAEAASNSFLGRFISNTLMPAAWTSVLGQIGSEAVEQQQQQEQQR